MRIVEGEYFYQKLENLEKADAIVILGGMLKINEFENNYVVEWADADRFFKGIELYNSFKSDKTSMIKIEENLSKKKKYNKGIWGFSNEL